METIKGCIDAIRFQDGAFLIAAFKVEDGTKIVVKGEIPGATVGMVYTLEVEETTDVRHGLTFVIRSAIPDLPTSTDAIEQYLKDLPGVGPSLAMKIVKTLGPDCINSLIECPEGAAKDVKGLGIKKATVLSETLKDRKEEVADAITLRTKLRVAPSHVVKKAIGKWGRHALNVLTENPYKLTWLPGIGFKIADAVAMEMGVKPDDDQRIIECVLHIIKERRSSGHTVHPLKSIVITTQNVLNAGDIREKILDMIVKDERVRAWESADVIQLESDHEDEQAIAAFVAERMGKSKVEVTLDVPEGLAMDQAEAFLAIQANPKVFLLTGAPGTGKTHLMRSVIEARGDAMLIAPTGKAAKRLSIATDMEAMTIHRAMEPNRGAGEDGEWGFHRGPDNPLETSFVVIDESSMVDTHLCRQLFDAISGSTDLLIVGDDNQLPSVGAGAVLRDLIAAGIPKFELTEIKRQDPGAIIQTCHLLKDGKPPRADLMNVSDLYMKQIHGNPDQIQAVVLESYFTGIPTMLRGQYPDRFGAMEENELATLLAKNLQILSPYRTAGAVSCKALNEKIRERLFEMGVLASIGKYRFATRDRVIQTRNDYSLGVYNGDTGTIVGASKDPKQIGEKDWYYKLDWDDNDDADIWVPVGSNSLEWAYCITVHKSQGSEWPMVMIPLATGAFFGRQLLYTGISRAKTFCALVGHFGNLQVIAASNSSAMRETGLTSKIDSWTAPVRSEETA